MTKKTRLVEVTIPGKKNCNDFYAHMKRNFCRHLGKCSMLIERVMSGAHILIWSELGCAQAHHHKNCTSINVCESTIT